MKDYEADWMQYYDPDKDELVIALILAISFRDWNSVQALVHIQPDINARDNMGDWTPLMHAVNEGHLESVKLLVEVGADVNLKGTFEPEEEFALNIAAYTNQQEIFEYLAPLTSLELRAIAEQTLSQNMNDNSLS